MRRRDAVPMLMALAAPTGAVRAQPRVAAADARAVRAVVEAQLAAFAAGDAARAFSFASPDIQAQFGDAETFVAMVRAGYAAVIRPARTSFLEADAVDGGVLQRVLLIDNAGQGWIATYLVQRQPDGRWRIGGCQVERSEGRFT